jgi:hypothetical protein
VAHTQDANIRRRGGQEIEAIVIHDVPVPPSPTAHRKTRLS